MRSRVLRGAMRLRVLTHPAMRLHEAPGHPERPERLVAMREGLEASALPLAWDEPRPATMPEILAVHEEAHVARVRAACERGISLDADTYALPASWEAALLAAGAAVEAARSAASGRPALALVRPPGHHATPSRAMGFCLLNNVAIAAQAVAAEGRRVAIVDVDVHHGNGTQDAFGSRGDVLFASLHQWPLYPGSGDVEEVGAGAGRGATLNVPLPAGTSHEGWLEAFDASVAPKVRAFAPDVILVSLGFDADHRDPLGGLRLHAPTFHAAIARLRGLCPRIAAVTEGGYDLGALREGAPAAAAALLGEPCPSGGEPPAGMRPWPALAQRIRRAHPGIA